MKPRATLFAAAVFSCSIGLAVARDLGPEDVAKLQAAGTIQALEKLDATALTTHPGAIITDNELEEEYGKYVYQVDLRDPQGIDWDVEVDATNGNILKDHQDK